MSESTFAVLGLFDSADALMNAIPAVRARGLGRLEAYTPYPIHGIDDALGLRRSPLGGMVLVMGILGALTALGFECWMSAVDYPIVTGGKPLFSWQAFVPIMFEVTVLFATFTAGLGMLLLLNRLPFFGHPVLCVEGDQGHHARSLRALDRSGCRPARRGRRPRGAGGGRRRSRSRCCPTSTAVRSSRATTCCGRSAASSPRASCPGC